VGLFAIHCSAWNGHSRKFASRNSPLAYNLACMGIENNGHVAYRLDTSELVGS